MKIIIFVLLDENCGVRSKCIIEAILGVANSLFIMSNRIRFLSCVLIPMGHPRGRISYKASVTQDKMTKISSVT